MKGCLGFRVLGFGSKKHEFCVVGSWQWLWILGVNEAIPPNLHGGAIRSRSRNTAVIIDPFGVSFLAWRLLSAKAESQAKYGSCGRPNHSGCRDDD